MDGAGHKTSTFSILLSKIKLPWLCFLGDPGVAGVECGVASFSRKISFSLINWLNWFNLLVGFIGKKDGEGSPNCRSSNDPDPERTKIILTN